MNNLHVTQNFEGLEHLLKYYLNFALFKHQSVFQEIFKVTTIAIVHDEIEVILSFNYVVQSYYIFVLRKVA
jgi:hypothetical protein